MRIPKECKLENVMEKEAGRPQYPWHQIKVERLEGADEATLTVSNGKVLAEVKVGPIEGDEGTAAWGPVLVPVEALKASRNGRESHDLSIGNGKAHVSTPNGELFFPLGEGKFPDTEAVWPKPSSEPTTIILDADLLWDLSRALGGRGGRRRKNGQIVAVGAVKLTIHDSETPVEVESITSSVENRGIIMPIPT